ncbi:MAG: DUF3850 domain-containing protein [Lachnospiraceae bacterium]|nr:DUF3850 domain-containing protein [Lachnospiraceae bacterium]
MIHSVKCHPDYFKALKDGTKTFEVRKKDCLYEVGDHLAVNEFVPAEQVDPYSLNVGLRQTSGGFYTGDGLLFKITYILDSAEYCKDGTVILGLVRCEI